MAFFPPLCSQFLCRFFLGGRGDSSAPASPSGYLIVLGQMTRQGCSFNFPVSCPRSPTIRSSSRQNRTHRLIQRIENSFQLNRRGFEVRQRFLEIVVLLQLDGNILNI